MNRKSFIRNTLLGLCASLLPEVLRPIDIYDGKKYKWYLGDEVGQMPAIILLRNRDGSVRYMVREDAEKEFGEQIKHFTTYYLAKPKNQDES